MGEVKKESLEKLLVLIDDICSKDENFWFKKKLLLTISNNNGFENFPEFVKYQKRQFRIKGNVFYKDIKDIKIKNELILDYMEMCWYQSINRVDRFVLFAFYQMENLLNYYSEKSGAFNKIKNNQNYYKHSYAPKFNIDAFKSYFHNNQAQSIEKINIWAKITYWMIETNSINWEKLNHTTLSNLVNIRNNESHRYSLIENENVNTTIDILKKSDFSVLGFYIKVLRKILDTINSSKFD